LDRFKTAFLQSIEIARQKWHNKLIYTPQAY
jgi:hypothetical protein